MRALFVAGARPNFVKVAPLLRAAEAAGIDSQLVHTGQHYDVGLDAAITNDLGLRQPDHQLGVGSGSQAQQVAAVMTALEPLVERLAPDVLVVVGDVNSTVGAALVGAKAPCLVAHVEAGLRSGDWTMPEEVNRVVTDRVSDLLFAPSKDAVANLEAEGVPEERVHLVGNVMVDSLLVSLGPARERAVARRLGLEPGRYAVATLHRPATVDQPHRLADVLAVLGRVAEWLPVVFPVHPRTQATLAAVEVPDGVVLSAPLGYLDFLGLQADAAVVLTDSGGVQEETTVLGVPCLTLRSTTERPVTVHEGTNRLVGLDPVRILQGVEDALAGRLRGRVPELWDGGAASRVVDILLSRIAARTDG